MFQFSPKGYGLLLLLGLATTLAAQSPVLVTDLNPGEGNAFDESPNIFRFGDHYLLFANNGETGKEPYVLQDGELTLLADINPGEESSRPGTFFRTDSVLYFLVRDTPTGSALWQTDGTPEGTTQVFDVDPDSDRNTVTGIVPGAAGNLYFTSGNRLYRFGAGGVKLVSSRFNFELGRSFFRGATAYAAGAYDDGLAVLFLRDDNIVELQHITDTVITVLDTFATTSRQVFGNTGLVMTPLPGGLFFSVAPNFTPDDSFGGSFVYDEAADSVRTLNIPPISRVHRINDSLVIAAAAGVGNGVREDNYYGFTSIDPSTEVILEGVDYDDFFGGKLRTYTDGRRLFLTANYGVGVAELYVTDGTRAGTKRVSSYSSRTEGFSNFLPVGDSVYWVTGVTDFLSDGQNFLSFNPAEDTPTFTTYYTDPNETETDESIELIGADGDRIYFIWDREAATGWELYYIIPPGLPTSISSPLARPTLQVSLAADAFRIEVESNTGVPARVMEYDLNGRLLSQSQVSVNNWVTLRPYAGARVLTFQHGDHWAVKRVLLPIR